MYKIFDYLYMMKPLPAHFETSQPDANKPYNDLPPLPPEQEKIESIKVLRQLVKSSVSLAELKGLTRTLPNPDILLNAVVLREARASSEIENVITTQDKLYQALSTKNMQADSATKEVLRYREAMLQGYRFIQKKGFLNTNAIIGIQTTLEENAAGIRKLPGTALRHSVTGDIIYTPPDRLDTIVRLMTNLDDYINDQDGPSALIKMAVQHYQFESIHPFYDGNGRTGRILNVLYLILHQLIESPVLYLSSYIIAHKRDYYRLLQEVRTKGNWEEWILFMLIATEHTAKKTITQISQINELFSKIQNTVRKKSPKVYSKELVELLFEHPYSKIEYVTERLGVSRITASKYLRELERINVLKSKQAWKETLYVNTSLFELLRSE